ncbi:MAG: ABC transporter ATP-binding protein [Halosimplex sp.]
MSPSTGGARNAVSIEGLTKRFGDVTAVDDLSLTVEEGEVFGFLGPNGAGKSTTINVLLGFLEPTAGSASVLGTDVTRDPRAVKARVGLMPEGFEAVPNLTGREHVAAAVETKGADDDPDALLERVGLDPDDARRPADDYSTGMFQRTALAVALVGDPDLLVLDEPSAGLDPNGVRLVREIVREEADRGAAVFFSSHILDEVERVSDRVGVLQDGRLTAVNSVENLRSDLGAGATVSATVDEVPDLDPVAAVDGVTDARADGSTVRVDCASSGAKMPALRAVDDRATVADVSVEETSLEDLFEAYTAGDSGADGGPDDGTDGGPDDGTDGSPARGGEVATATAGGDGA